jgi:hypothetical protein
VRRLRLLVSPAPVQALDSGFSLGSEPISNLQ